MNNWNIVTKAQSEAANSAGSSMLEVSKRSDSLEARIARLKNSFIELSVAFGNAFLSDSLVGVIAGLTEMAKFGASVVNTVGVLPILLGSVSAAFFLTNKSVRDFVVNSKIAGVEVRSLSQGFTMLRTSVITSGAAIGLVGKAVTGLKIAFRGLLASTGIGLLFVGLGFGIEKLISSISNSIEETKKLEAEQNKIAQSYGTNRKHIDSLIVQHEQLSSIKNKSAEEEQKHLDIQKELGNSLPNLIEKVDAYGNVTIKSGKALQEEIKYAKELVELQKQQIKQDYTEKFEKSIDKRKKAMKEIKDLQSDLENPDGYYSQKDDYAVGKMSEKDIAKAQLNLRAYQREVANTNLLIRDQVNSMITEILKLNNVEINDSLASQIKEAVEAMDVKDLDAEEIAGKAQDLSNAIADYQNKLTDGSSGQAVQQAVRDMEKLAQSLGFTEEESKEFVKTLLEQANAHDKAGQSAEEQAKANEELLKSYDNAVDNISSLNGILNELNDEDSFGISADSISMLMEKYPELLGYINDEGELRNQIIKKIEEEENTALDVMTKKLEGNEQYFNAVIKGNEALVKSLADSYNVDLDNVKSVAQLKFQVEQNLIKKLGETWSKYYSAQAQAFTPEGNEALKYMTAQAAMNSPEMIAIGNYQVAMNQLSDSLRSVTSDFTGGSLALEGLDTATKSSSKSTSKAAKENDAAKYVADKYREALEKVNFELEKQNKIQAEFPDYSKDYQNSLKKEIDLLTQKKDILNAQRKEMEKQIKNGNIQQTGVVKTSTSSSPTALSGGGNATKIWNFFKSKGMSDTVTAGIMGNLQLESGLNSSALNPSSGAYGIAQWLGGRKTGLQSFASSRGTSSSDLGTQLDFLWKELNGSENRTMQYLMGNQSASASTIAAMFDKLFERSEGTHIPQRQSYANQFLSKFRGSAATGEVSQEYAQQLSDVDNAKLDVIGLKQEMLDIDSQLSQLQLDIINSEVSKYDHLKSQLSDDFAKIERQMSMESETSKNWINLQLKKESLIRKEVEYQQKSIDYIKKQIKSNKELSKAQKMLLNDQLVDRTTELYQLEMKILDERKSMADTILDTYKKAAEAQKDASLKVIDDMLAEIDKEISDADYKKRLADQQKDRQELLDEMASLSMDDTDSAKKRLRELTEQLQEMDESIADIQDDRATDLRREALNQQKEDITSNYENLVNDEKKFAEMRSKIINGSIKDISKTLNAYLVNVKSNSEVLGKALSNNLISLINQANSYLNGKNYKPIKVAQAKEGGILPSWGSSGKMMYVHENEMISNKHDTKNLLKSFSMADELINKIKVASLKIPSLLGNNNSKGGNTYNLSLSIDSLNGTKEDADYFWGEVVSGVKILGGDI